MSPHCHDSCPRRVQETLATRQAVLVSVNGHRAQFNGAHCDLVGVLPAAVFEKSLESQERPFVKMPAQECCQQRAQYCEDSERDDAAQRRPQERGKVRGTEELYE